MSNFNEIDSSNRPREKALKYGVSSLSTIELLAIIIRTGTKNKSVLQVANDLIKDLKNISHIQNLTLSKLKSYEGIGEVKAIEILTIVELSKRIILNDKDNVLSITKPKDVYDFAIKELYNKKSEVFMVLLLNTNKQVIHHEIISQGTLNQTIVHPRNVFNHAITTNADSIIIIHNHPSNDPTPSQADIAVTDKLVEASKLLSIVINDHVIITDKEYFSFRENGLM